MINKNHHRVDVYLRYFWLCSNCKLFVIMVITSVGCHIRQWYSQKWIPFYRYQLTIVLWNVDFSTHRKKLSTGRNCQQEEVVSFEFIVLYSKTNREDVLSSQIPAGDWFWRYRLAPGHWVWFLAYASKFKSCLRWIVGNLLSQLHNWNALFAGTLNLLNLKVIRKLSVKTVKSHFLVV